MCNCLEKTEKEVKKMLVSRLTKQGKQFDSFVNESEGGFTCKGLMFSSGRWEFVLPLEFKYALIKKNGEKEKRASIYKTNFIPSYCPICGKKKVKK